MTTAMGEVMASAENATGSGQYVVFALGEDVYGIDVMAAQEVIGVGDIRYVPGTQPYMKGVTDLRGTIVPVIDLRLKFGLPARPYDAQTVIVITEAHGALVGIVVDAVLDVRELAHEEVQHTPHFTVRVDRDAVRGIGKINDRIIVIIDAERVFSGDEMVGMLEAGSVSSDIGRDEMVAC